MAVFPVFIDLSGKKCVVIGGGKVASRKTAALVDFDAEILVVSPALSGELQEFQQRGKIIHSAGEYSETDLTGAFLAVAATNDRTVNEQVYHDAVKNGILVNTADNPAQCTFIFPAIVKKDDLVIGISTSGKYPGLSKSIRQMIDQMLARRIDTGIIGILETCRARALAEIESEARRREILDRILDEAVFGAEVTDSRQVCAKIEMIFGEYQNEKDN
jgi:precorrin-2 dehydrogenase/sirohydrochlorin ferrochelatase